MSSDASAYKALGLKPGADGAAVERAYKVLIKKYHPDREGGDALRAAEINQAYFELRQPVEQGLERNPPVDIAEALYARRATRSRTFIKHKRRRRIWPLVLLLGLAAVGYFERDAVQALAGDVWAEAGQFAQPPSPDQPKGELRRPASLDGPIENAIIVEAVRSATKLTSGRHSDAAIEESRTCHRELRANASVAKLDACAAFDDAVLEITNPDPVHEEGAFGASAVTARQMSAAALLSSDYPAIEDRLDRVRARVQVLLAPSAAPTPVKRVEVHGRAGARSGGAHKRRRSRDSA